MNGKLINLLGAALIAVVASGTNADAMIYGQPCELCGIAWGAPLPEGVFFVDYESYGQRDGQSNRLGVNEPTFIWSTPFTFYDTRLEIVAPDPIFTHIDGPTINRTDAYAPVIFALFAHDFGNGFQGGISFGVHGQDNFTEKGRGAAADIRPSLSYLKDGWNATITLNYSGNFGGKTTGYVNGLATGFDDNLFIDYTLTHKFGKLELGLVGYAQSDIDGPLKIHPASVAIGGLIGYDFGKFTIQTYVTREVAVRAGGYGLGPNYADLTTGNGGKETRGYFRLIYPIYLAPKATTPIAERY